MKTRNSFVSNSSSSSFVVWGTILDTDKLEEHLDATKPNWRTYTSKWGKGETYEYEDVVEYLQETSQFAVMRDEWHSETYIGISPFCCKDNETMLQFKESIAAELTELTGIEYKATDLQAIEEVVPG